MPKPKMDKFGSLTRGRLLILWLKRFLWQIAMDCNIYINIVVRRERGRERERERGGRGEGRRKRELYQ